MNKKEYLITCLIEELAEVQQALSKVLRFTENDRYKGNEYSNIDNVNVEWSDVITVKEMLEDEGFIIYASFERMDAKKRRLLEFMKHSEHLGVLEEA